MIQKIVDWTAGSFFRTIGRLLVFVIIGFLVAHLVDFSSIKWTDLLGFETVHAASNYGNRILSQSDLTYAEFVGNVVTNDLTTMNLNSNYYLGINRLSGTKYTINQSNRKFAIASSQFYNANYDYVYFNLYVMINVCSSSVDNALCSEIVGAHPNLTFNNIPCETIDWSETIVGDSSSSNGGRHVYQNITYKCPNTNGPYVIAYFDEFNYNYMYARIGINRQIWYSNLGATDNQAIIDAIRNSNAGVTGAIEGQTQQQQQQHNETMSYFQDTNTTSTEEEASSFFDDFSVTDHGGLSSIITAPLTIVNKVLEDTCTPATFTYRNKQVSLPCGQYFWNQAPELRDWLSTIESGIIAYAILVSLFKMIQKLESPSNSEVEVESL